MRDSHAHLLRLQARQIAEYSLTERSEIVIPSALHTKTEYFISSATGRFYYIRKSSTSAVFKRSFPVHGKSMLN